MNLATGKVLCMCVLTSGLLLPLRGVAAVPDALVFVLDIGDAAHLLKHLPGLVVLVLGDQPPRALGHEEEPDKLNQGWNSA